MSDLVIKLQVPINRSFLLTTHLPAILMMIHFVLKMLLNSQKCPILLCATNRLKPKDFLVFDHSRQRKTANPTFEKLEPAGL